jgi:alginate O-acetyltransferase complex protein AlgI
MVFSSTVFLFIFLPFTLLGYHLLPVRLRKVFLLLMSWLFYAWGEPVFVIIMIASILINYGAGLLIAMVSHDAAFGRVRRIGFLVLALLLNLGILFYFKYFDFAISVFNDLFHANASLREIVLPIGISFFTFQGLSYVLDLYMGNVRVQMNPLHIALYISLFPQLIAGPIVRYRDISDQIEQRHVDVDMFTDGIRRFCIGLAKKVLIANQMALAVDDIFALLPEQNLAMTAWLGVICYTFQIYFDFSGYSDMAIGLGRMFGFRFLENFNYPYISVTVSEFWRRWHISLSGWFRDYLYIPLGGNRRGNVYINLIIVFFCTGLWHGAKWNFIVWGLWHGLFLLIEKRLRRHKSSVKQWVRGPLSVLLAWLYTMSVVVVGWVFFRSDDLTYALRYLTVMFGLVPSEDVHFLTGWYLDRGLAFMLLVACAASVPWSRVFARFRRGKTDADECVVEPGIASQFGERLKSPNGLLVLKNAAVILLLILSVMSLMTGTYNPFIYFRF